MIRRPLYLAFGTLALLGLASQASAQIIGGLPQLQKAQIQQMKLLEQQLKLLNQDLFKQLQLDPEALKQLQLDPNGLQQLQQLQLNQRVGAGQLSWAGMQLKKTTVAEQQNLGLPENEGLVIAAVAPNSAGDKAGLKVNDILVKINKKAVPNDHPGFAKLLKDTDPAAEAMEITVLRDGKEEKINAGKMPLTVQTLGSGTINRAGGIQIRPGININGLKLSINPKGIVPGAGLPKANPNPFPNNPPPPANPKPEPIPDNVQNLNLSLTINGAKLTRKQHNADFSGEYTKGDLNITIAGKIANGVAKATEITINEKGKDAKKYTSIHDVPGQYRSSIHQIMPTANGDGFNLPKAAPDDPNQKREL